MSQLPPTPVAPAQHRRAGRVLLVDDAARLLLLRGGDPSAPERGQWWFTPGGGLEPGEQPRAAAARELAEETGLVVPAADLGAVVHERTTLFRFAGRDYEQHENYYLLNIDAFEVDLTGAGVVVDQGVTGHRWWPIAELRASTDTVFPPELVDVLDRLGVR